MIKLLLTFFSIFFLYMEILYSKNNLNIEKFKRIHYIIFKYYIKIEHAIFSFYYTYPIFYLISKINFNQKIPKKIPLHSMTSEK